MVRGSPAKGGLVVCPQWTHVVPAWWPVPSVQGNPGESGRYGLPPLTCTYALTRIPPDRTRSHWQCGGQGFESPQLHPRKWPLSRHFVFEVRASSALVPSSPHSVRKKSAGGSRARKGRVREPSSPGRRRVGCRWRCRREAPHQVSLQQVASSGCMRPRRRTSRSPVNWGSPRTGPRPPRPPARTAERSGPRRHGVDQEARRWG